jgi:Protein of unknown function (DUF2442)
VPNITPQGFWLLLDNQEYFVPSANYPLFHNATVAQIHALRHTNPGQIHWPALAADIELVALARPESYPLQFQP